MKYLLAWILAGALGLAGSARARAASDPPGAPFCDSELIFPPETWHVHASCVVELPGGDLLACWFHGSGERTADDVKIQGARLRKGSHQWSERFVMADTPGYPDCNPALFVDPKRRLWLFWPTILANRWETALMKYRVSSDYRRAGAPRWEREQVLHVTPGAGFETQVVARLAEAEPILLAGAADPEARAQVRAYFKTLRERASDKLSRRLGWMTRAHPVTVGGTRLIVPLYSDGFDFSLMALTDDWGATWQVSAPLVGAGNIQPSIVQRRDGSLYTLMRDNGPAPQRLMQSESRDQGLTWSPVTDSDVPNPGSGAEVIRLRNGHWLLIGNDTEDGRHQLVVMLSDDEGRSWRWRRYLERDAPGQNAGQYHYPSVLQARDGTLHATYSHHLRGRNLPRDADGDPAGKSIKHAHFNESWVQAGD